MITTGYKIDFMGNCIAEFDFFFSTAAPQDHPPALEISNLPALEFSSCNELDFQEHQMARRFAVIVSIKTEKVWMKF